MTLSNNSSRGPGVSFQHPHGGSQLSVTPVPEDPTPSHRHTNARRIPRHIKQKLIKHTEIWILFWPNIQSVYFGPALECGNIPNETPMEKSRLFFPIHSRYQQIASWLEVCVFVLFPLCPALSLSLREAGEFTVWPQNLSKGGLAGSLSPISPWVYRVS